MERLDQVAQNIVNILSDWKDENDKYKANIDKFQAGMDVQFASLKSLIDSNTATQSNAVTENAQKSSGKRALAQSSNENAVQAKRLKNNDAEPVASCKLQVWVFFHINFIPCLFLLISHLFHILLLLF